MVGGRVGVAVGSVGVGVSCGGSGVFVVGAGVGEGGPGVSVVGAGVSVGGIGVGVGGIGVSVAGPGVTVGHGVAVGHCCALTGINGGDAITSKATVSKMTILRKRIASLSSTSRSMASRCEKWVEPYIPQASR